MRSSRYPRTSSSRSRSTRSPWASVRHMLTTLRSRDTLLLGLQHLCDGKDDAGPLIELACQLTAAFGGELIRFHAPPFGREGPLALNETLLLEAMEGRKERSRLDLKCAGRDLLDALGDADAVTRLELKRTKNQKVQSTAKELGARHRGPM